MNLLYEILNAGLFAGAQRPLAILTSFAKGNASSSGKVNGEYKWPEFPAPVKVIEIADDSSYYDELKRVIDEEEPDAIFLAPPLREREALPAAVRRAYPELEQHEIVLMIVINNASVGCRIGAWMPRGFFVNTSAAPLRNQITREAPPRLILEIGPPPKDRHAFYSWSFYVANDDLLSFRLLVLENGPSPDHLVRFFRIVHTGNYHPLSGERQAALATDLRRLLRQGGGATEFGFVLREGLPPDAPWLYFRHHPNYRRRLEDLEYFGDVRPLGELVDLWLGFQNAQFVNALISAEESERGIPVLEGREIENDGTLSGKEPRYRMLEESAQDFLLQVGDICLKSTLGDSRRLNAVLISEEMLPLAVNNSAMVLRPKAEVNLDVQFLTAFLQSDHVVDSLRAQGIAQNLFAASLAEVQVPLQDEELAAVMRDLRQAAQALGEWQEEAQAAIRSLFDFKSAKDARAFLLESGRRVRQRERAARQIDDLSYRLRTGLPHPLAYRWRAAETAPVNLEGYKEVLDCAETGTCYLALSALVMMRAIGEELPYLDTLVPRLSDPSRGGGTNFGDWVAIVREVNGRRTLKEQINAPFYQVARFLDDKTVNDALSLLKMSRDDESHGRGPRGAELEASVAQCREALRIFFEALEFLSEYSLRYIEETNRDSLSGITHYRYREMMGDHPLVSMVDDDTSTAELEAHSLYLTDRTEEMFLLRPYLTRARCPQCGGWESFFLDRYDARSGCCTLKSLEKGHTFEDDGITAVFKQVGLLS